MSVLFRTIAYVVILKFLVGCYPLVWDMRANAARQQSFNRYRRQRRF